MHLEGKELEAWKKIVTGQDADVLGHFANHAQKDFTPWEISDATGIFITNVRRSINTLQKEGWLIHVSERRAKTTHLNNTYQYQSKK